MVPALAYGHDLYFDGPGDLVVPLASLVATKPPEDQPRSVEVASERMLDAAAGRLSRRAPITVRRREDGRFDIVDGNATFGAALRAGWPDLPVRVARDP